MTEPMTAREQMTPIERVTKFLATLEPYPDLKNDPIFCGLLALQFEADRADERARLAQSGDVEDIAAEIIAILGIRLAGGIAPEPVIALARHVQTKLAAVAEAARIEARDAIAEWHDAEADRLFRVEGYFADNHEQSIIFGKEASDHRKYAEYVRALRPDELEKKT